MVIRLTCLMLADARRYTYSDGRFGVASWSIRAPLFSENSTQYIKVEVSLTAHVNKAYSQADTCTIVIYLLEV